MMVVNWALMVFPCFEKSNGKKKAPAQQNNSAKAFCGNCGAQVQPGKKFCPECGMQTDAAHSQNKEE